MGSNLLANHQIDTAISFFDQSLQKKPDTLLAAQALFNKACALFRKSDFQKSADGFKNVLRYTPGDYRAQYNLSLALAHIPPQEQDDQKDKDQQDQDKNDKNKDQDKDQDQKNNDDQDKKSDDKKDQDKKDQDQKDKQDEKSDQKDQNKKGNKEDAKNSPQKGKLSPQDVERLYQALDQQEKAVQKRIMTQQKGDESNQPFIEKDW